MRQSLLQRVVAFMEQDKKLGKFKGLMLRTEWETNAAYTKVWGSKRCGHRCALVVNAIVPVAMFATVERLGCVLVTYCMCGNVLILCWFGVSLRTESPSANGAAAGT